MYSIKIYYKIRSFVAINWSKLLPSSYKKFTLSNTKIIENYEVKSNQKPLHQSSVAIMTSAGVHLKNDEPFNVETLEGDHSYRVIPADTPEDDLTVTHIYYNTKYPKKDISIVFPLSQLRGLKEEAFIGDVSNYNIGLNGGTLNHKPHEEVTAPRLAKLIKQKEVDIVILIPG